MEQNNVRGYDFDREKLKALVHYICYKADSSLGATKLNKSLWYADVWSYVLDGEPITGESYVKQQYGPVPRHILEILHELAETKQIAIRDTEYYGYPKKDFVPLKKPNLSLFSPAQISLIDEVVNIVCHNHTAKSISELTHDETWSRANLDEEIPLHTVFVKSAGKASPAAINWATVSMQGCMENRANAA